MKHPHRIWLLIVLTLGLGACAAVESTPNTPVPSATPSGVRHQFEDGIFSLALPAAWSVSAAQEVRLNSGVEYRLYWLGVDPDTQGGPGLSRVIVGSLRQLTIGRFIQSQCEACAPPIIEPVSLGAFPALKLALVEPGQPSIEWYLVQIDDRLIALAIHDPQSMQPLEQVLQSLIIH